MPWGLDNKKLGFARGYHSEVGGGMGMPGYGFGWGIEGYNGRAWGPNGTEKPKGGGGYGAELKEDYRRFYGAFIGFAGRGECIAREDNRSEEHTSELQSLMRISYAVCCLKNKRRDIRR